MHMGERRLRRGRRPWCRARHPCRDPVAQEHAWAALLEQVAEYVALPSVEHGVDGDDRVGRQRALAGLGVHGVAPAREVVG
jgi:hypothetical protein